MENIKIIGKNKIICCDQNTSVTEELPEASMNTEILEKTILDLSEENEQKNKHIEKMKRENAVLLEEGAKNEAELENFIADQKSIINNLTKQVSELRNEIKKMKGDANDHQPQLSNFSENASISTNTTSEKKGSTTGKKNSNVHRKEIQTINRDGKKSQNVSEHNNDVSQVRKETNKNINTETRIKQSAIHKHAQVRDVIKITNTGNNQVNHMSTRGTPAEGDTKKRRQRVLILSGNTAYNCGSVLREQMSDVHLDIDIQYVNKTKTYLEDIVENHSTLSKSFDKRDWRIVFMGSGEASNGKQIRQKVIDDLIKNSTHTNTIVVGTPYHRNRPVLNRFIDETNANLKYSLLNTSHVIFIDPNDVLRPFQTSHNGIIKNCGITWIFKILLSYIDSSWNERSSTTSHTKEKICPTENNISLAEEITQADSNPVDLNDPHDEPKIDSVGSRISLSQNQYFLYPRLSQLILH